jgi:hypothetical protein
VRRGTGRRRAGRDGGGIVELEQSDLDLAVHDQRELVVRGRPPAGGALGANGLDHVLDVLADRDLLVGLGLAGHLEDVGEDVVLGVVVDDLDAALVIVLERAEACRLALRHC